MIDTITKITLTVMIALHKRELNLYESVLSREVNCRGCIHSDKGTPAKCKKYDMIAPPEVLEAGCDEWQFDAIPF